MRKIFAAEVVLSALAIFDFVTFGIVGNRDFYWLVMLSYPFAALEVYGLGFLVS